MNLLLDTNVLLRWAEDSPRLVPDARALIADSDNSTYVSAVVAWEIAIKVGLGKLQLPGDLPSWLPETLKSNGFAALAITQEHALAVENLPLHHRDPFDRLLIAQAQIENLHIVTADPRFERYDVRVIRC